MEAALKAGYRLIDCAHFYANEPEIGEALQKCFKGGVVKREDVFIISKLWYIYPFLSNSFSMHTEGVEWRLADGNIACLFTYSCICLVEIKCTVFPSF